MARKSAKEIKAKILAMWRTRPAEQRRQKDTEQFTVDVWNEGLRLAPTEPLHYQHVMNLIRFLTTDDGE